MKILYLLLSFFLLFIQDGTGSSLTPGNEGQCKQEGGFCSFLTCYHPHHIFGRCSNIYGLLQKEIVMNSQTF